MLNINLLQIINNKTISIKYIIKSLDKPQQINNTFNINIFELLNLLNSLSLIYLYIYKYISLHQKLLISTNYIQNIFTLKSIAALTTNYYIYNTRYFKIFSNWTFLKKKLILYKWLKYFFLTNLAVKNKCKNTLYLNHTLYLLYCKLKLKYHGLKNLNVLPNTLIFIIIDNDKLLKEILKLNQNIILINNISNKLFTDNIKILTNFKNFTILNFILKIISTAIFHGILS